MVERTPAIGTRWRNWKGGIYTVIGRAISCNNGREGEMLVLYVGAGGKTLARSAFEWYGHNGSGKKRFILIKE